MWETAVCLLFFFNKRRQTEPVVFVCLFVSQTTLVLDAALLPTPVSPPVAAGLEVPARGSSSLTQHNDLFVNNHLFSFLHRNRFGHRPGATSRAESDVGK